MRVSSPSPPFLERNDFDAHPAKAERVGLADEDFAIGREGPIAAARWGVHRVRVEHAVALRPVRTWLELVLAHVPVALVGDELGAGVELGAVVLDAARVVGVGVREDQLADGLGRELVDDLFLARRGLVVEAGVDDHRAFGGIDQDDGAHRLDLRDEVVHGHGPHREAAQIVDAFGDFPGDFLGSPGDGNQCCEECRRAECRRRCAAKCHGVLQVGTGGTGSPGVRDGYCEPFGSNLCSRSPASAPRY